MFGNPRWFRPKAIGWGLIPIRWQGWTYTAGWAGAITLPFLLLIARHQPLEAIAWMGISLGALTYDVRQILRAFHDPLPTARKAMAAATADNGILYISDSQPAPSVATRNYDLHVCR